MANILEIMERTQRLYDLLSQKSHPLALAQKKYQIFCKQAKLYQLLTTMKSFKKQQFFHTPIRNAILQWASIWVDQVSQAYGSRVSMLGKLFWLKYIQATLRLNQGIGEHDMIAVRYRKHELEHHCKDLERHHYELRNRRIVLERRFQSIVTKDENLSAAQSINVPVTKSLNTVLDTIFTSLMRQSKHTYLDRTEKQLQSIERRANFKSGASRESDLLESIDQMDRNLKKTLNKIYTRPTYCRPKLTKTPPPPKSPLY